MRFQREIHYYKNSVKPSSSFQHLCTSQLPLLLFLSPLISILAVRLKSIWIKHNINRVKCILNLAKVTVAWNVRSWIHCSQNFTIFKTRSLRLSTDCWSSLNDRLSTINRLSRLSTIHIKYTGHRNVTAFTFSGVFVSKKFQIKQAGNLPTVFCKASTSSSWWWWVLCFRRAWTSSASWTFKSYCCFIWRYLRGKMWGKVIFKPALILHEHIKWLWKVRVAYFSAIFL